VFNYIVSCGCSFVEGIGCARRLDERMTKLVANKFQSEDINFAVSGGSNDRSVRKITDWVINNKNKLDKTLFLIGTTGIARFELWDNILESYGQGNTSRVDRVNKDFRNSPTQLVMGIQKTIAKYHQSEKSDLDKTLRNILSLMLLLEKYNCKYIIFDSITNIKKIAKEHDYFNEVFSNKNYYSNESWEECMLNNSDLVVGDHPDTKINQLWFEKLIRHGEGVGLWKE